MKKITLSFALFLAAGVGMAAVQPDERAESALPLEVSRPEAAECSLPKNAANPAHTVVAAKLTPAVPVYRTEKEAKKAFEKRRKLIKKLVKKYRKASEAEKTAVKAQLTAVVSEGMDQGLAFAKEYIAAQRANLEKWSAKLAEEEKDFDAVKARRVEDLLSGEAERKHKEAQKQWKQEMREAKKNMD